MGAQNSRQATANDDFTMMSTDDMSFMSTNADTSVSSMSTAMPGVKARGGAVMLDAGMWANAQLAGGGRCEDCPNKGQDCPSPCCNDSDADDYTINTNNYRSAFSGIRNKFR